jgi:hypothetical protein
MTTRIASICVLSFTLTALPAFAQKASEKMAEDRQTFRKSVVEIRDQIDRTLGALDEIAKGKDAAARKPALKTFASERAKMEKQADKTADYAQQLRERGKDYFKGWEKSMKGVTNADLKAAATERRAAIEAQYKKIEDGIGQAKEAGPAFRKNLADLQKYYENDLSNEAIATSSKLVETTKSDGKKIQDAIDSVLAAVDDVGKKVEEKSPAASPAPDLEASPAPAATPAPR